MIEQPARGGDDDVDAAAEGMLLRAHADAAEDRRAGERRMHREAIELLEDLRSQLARRRQDERARRAARLVHQSVQYREQEGDRLAAARLRAGQQVSPLQRRRNRLSLNRRGTCEPEFADALEKIRMDMKAGERHRNRTVYHRARVQDVFICGIGIVVALSGRLEPRRGADGLPAFRTSCY